LFGKGDALLQRGDVSTDMLFEASSQTGERLLGLWESLDSKQKAKLS